jgi:hypothetical protein
MLPTISDEQIAWLAQQKVALNQVLHDFFNTDTPTFCKVVLYHLAENLQSIQVLMYYYEANDNVLYPVAAYAQTLPTTPLQIGQGLLGQVAETQVLKHFRDIPAKHAIVPFNTLDIYLSQTITLPIVNRGQIKAVMQFDFVLPPPQAGLDRWGTSGVFGSQNRVVGL